MRTKISTEGSFPGVERRQDERTCCARHCRELLRSPGKETRAARDGRGRNTSSAYEPFFALTACRTASAFVVLAEQCSDLGFESAGGDLDESP